MDLFYFPSFFLDKTFVFSGLWQPKGPVVAAASEGRPGIVELLFRPQGWPLVGSEEYHPCTHILQVLEDSREDYFALAPQSRQCERREVLVEHHQVVSRARRGDLVRVVRNIGGGGGHRLTVKDFKMTIIHKSPIE